MLLSGLHVDIVQKVHLVANNEEQPSSHTILAAVVARTWTKGDPASTFQPAAPPCKPPTALTAAVVQFQPDAIDPEQQLRVHKVSDSQLGIPRQFQPGSEQRAVGAS